MNRTIPAAFIGNSDAHGKNFSLLHTATGARLAPLYDLVSTRVYPYLSENMAMKIGNEKFSANVGLRDWRKLFAGAELGQAAADQRLQNLTKRVLRETQAMSEAAFPGTDVVSGVIIANCHRLLSLDWERK